MQGCRGAGSRGERARLGVAARRGVSGLHGISRGESPGISQGELALHLTEHKEVPEGIGILLDVESVYDFFDDLKSKKPDMP